VQLCPILTNSNKTKQQNKTTKQNNKTKQQQNKNHLIRASGRENGQTKSRERAQGETSKTDRVGERRVRRQAVEDTHTHNKYSAAGLVILYQV